MAEWISFPSILTSAPFHLKHLAEQPSRLGEKPTGPCEHFHKCITLCQPLYRLHPILRTPTTMPQSLSQPAPQLQELQSFLIDFLPWFCISISSIFILILLRKHVVGLCRNLWSYLPRSLRISVEDFRFGQNCRRKGVYMKIDESGEIGNDNCFVDTGNDEDISYVGNLSRAAIYPTPG